MKVPAVIPDDVVAVLKERAKAEDRSLGSVIRRALTDDIQRTGGGGTPDALPPENRNDADR